MRASGLLLKDLISSWTLKKKNEFSKWRRNGKCSRQRKKHKYVGFQYHHVAGITHNSKLLEWKGEDRNLGGEWVERHSSGGGQRPVHRELSVPAWFLFYRQQGNAERFLVEEKIHWSFGSLSGVWGEHIWGDWVPGQGKTIRKWLQLSKWGVRTAET